MKPTIILPLAVLLLVELPFAADAEVVELRPALVEKDGVVGIEYRSGGTLVGRSTEAAPAGVELLLPGGKAAPVQFRTKTEHERIIELGPVKVGTLTLRWRIARKAPALVERTLEVTADAAQQFAATFPLDLALEGQFASFSGPEKARTLYDTVRGSAKTETFPVAMLRTSGSVFGIVADSPGLWENRCQVVLDPPSRRLAVLTGDGRAAYPLIIKPPEDARDTYQYQTPPTHPYPGKRVSAIRHAGDETHATPSDRILLAAGERDFPGRRAGRPRLAAGVLRG